MKRTTRTLAAILTSACLFGVGYADTGEPSVPPLEKERIELGVDRAASQEACIEIMAAFPDNGHVPRYQFFRLAQEIGTDATPAFRAAIREYGQGSVAPDTPIADIIEGIANPVLRQAAPSIAVAQMAHLIEFSQNCDTFVAGQAASLEAFDPTLANGEFNAVIAEDALFLRQVLADVLYRLEADQDAVYGPAIISYAASLVEMRDNIEFAAFDSEVEELETLFMEDLDGRLARSNDIINGEMNNEAIANAIALSDDLNDAARELQERQARETLYRILFGYL
jgi:hypothetical protein